MPKEKQIIEECINSGLFSPVEENQESYFTWHGCDYCNATKGKILGNSVKDYRGYRSLEQAKKENYYEFKLCDNCHYELYYGKG